MCEQNVDFFNVKTGGINVRSEPNELKNNRKFGNKNDNQIRQNPEGGYI